MIKTLRIASIAAVVLAAAFFVFPAVFGVQREEETEQFLKSPGVIEQLGKADDRKKIQSDSQDAPLVKQAEAFALYLNPPQPKEPAGGPALPAGGDAPRPRIVTPKFNLIGTSFYASNPQLSLALIDEPGKGLRWVRQSSKVGHLVIEQVKDGAIVVRDGQNTSELAAERPQKINLVKSSSIVIAGVAAGEHPASPVVGPEPSLSDSNKSNAGVAVGEPPASPVVGPESSLSDSNENSATVVEEEPPNIEEEIAGIEGLLKEIESMKMDVKSGVGDSNQPEGEDAAALKEFMLGLEDELKTMRISAEEAKKLGDLGETLKDIQQGPNLPAGGGSEANEREVNKPDG